jgi:hypothetical protein
MLNPVHPFLRARVAPPVHVEVRTERLVVHAVVRLRRSRDSLWRLLGRPVHVERKAVLVGSLEYLILLLAVQLAVVIRRRQVRGQPVDVTESIARVVAVLRQLPLAPVVQAFRAVPRLDRSKFVLDGSAVAQLPTAGAHRKLDIARVQRTSLLLLLLRIELLQVHRCAAAATEIGVWVGLFHTAPGAVVLLLGR